MNEREQVIELLKSQTLCTIATNGVDGYPNAASVAFSSTPTLTFVIATDDGTRKAANIIRDERAAITVTNPETRQTIQAEGTIAKITPEEFDNQYADEHFRKLPFTRFFRDIPTYSFYVFAPIHLKFTDITQKPWLVVEIIH